MFENLLSQGDTLRLTRPNGTKGDWTIVDFVGQGASCCCYSACDSDGRIGRLKEFWPSDLPFLSRGENQLLMTRAFKQLYNQRSEVFLRGFRLLEDARNRPEGAALNNFLPPVQEVLRGEDGGLYIFSPHDRAGKTLEVIFKETPLAKRSLGNVLTLAKTLAEFLYAVHSLAFVHLDLKPSNILYVNPEHVTVFDIDSVFDLMSDKPCLVRGTEGFSAPELNKFGDISNRCDIYSLGAVLFTAIVGQRYSPEDFQLLASHVERSPLCRELSIKERRRMTSLLQQCLAFHPWQRFLNVEKLIEALEELRQNSADVRRGDPTTAIRNLLWRKTVPLSANTQIAVIGAGTVSQAFIDHILQLQVPKVKINIMAYSLEAERDKDDYLSPRPMARDYLDISGSLAKIKSLGRVEFLSVPTLNGLPFTKENAEVNRLIAEQIVDNQLSFVFIALGDDALNSAVAKVFRDLTNCPVAVIGHDEEIDPQLARFAFNAHLTWFGSLAGDMKSVREQFFEDTYNFSSSLNYAVSLKYKILALGVDFCPDVSPKVAECVKRRLESLTTDDLKSNFIAEHNRWILEKLVGWSPMMRSGQVDYEACIESLRSTGKIQDARHLKHQCLIPYDALDEMSRGLHEALAIRANRIKNSIAFRLRIENLRGKLKENPTLLFAVMQILGGNKAYCRDVKKHLTALKAAAIFDNEEFDAFRRDFLVVAEAAMNRDYRAYDALLVEQLPFILTWDFPRLAISFDPNASLSNVASAVVLNPVDLSCLFVFDARTKPDFLAESVRRVVSFLKEKLQADISFVVADMLGTFDPTILDGLAVTFRQCRDVESAVDFFLEELARRNCIFDGSNALLTDNLAQSQFVTKIVSQQPYFEFDYPTKAFRHMRGCEHFAYLRDDSSISVNDLISLTNTEATVVETDSVSLVYEPLWEKLRQEPTAVLQCLRELEVYDYKDFASTLIASSGSDAKSMEFLIASNQELVAEKFLRELQAAGVLLEFALAPIGNGMISVSLVSNLNNQPVLTKIFDGNLFQDEPTIRRRSNFVSLIFRSATLNELPVSDATISVLNVLEDMNFLRDLRIIDRLDRKVAAFRYATVELRNFLTLRRVIRAFLYSEVLKRGVFNDIACDVTFKRFGVNSTFDLVLVKGFAVIVIRIASEPNFAQLYEFAAQGNEFLRSAEKVLVVPTIVPDENFCSLALTLNIFVISPTNLSTFVDKFVNLIKE